MNKYAPHKLARLAASGAISTVAGKVYGVLLFGGSAATSLKLTNDADGSGVAVLNVNTVINQSFFLDLSELGPVEFNSKIYGTLAGTGGEAYVFWE